MIELSSRILLLDWQDLGQACQWLRGVCTGFKKNMVAKVTQVVTTIVPNCMAVQVVAGLCRPNMTTP
eukprot:1159587-Pelagomonas_calceolata.AAC.7